MDTNNTRPDKAKLELFENIKRELLEETKDQQTQNGTKRETSRLLEKKEPPKTPDKTEPKKPVKCMRGAIQRMLYEDDGRLADEIAEAMLVTAIGGSVPAMKLVLKLTN